MLISLSAGLLAPALPMSYKSRFFTNLSEEKKKRKKNLFKVHIFFLLLLKSNLFKIKYKETVSFKR